MIKRNAETMKTQRLDERVRRLKEEKERRKEQRKIFYERRLEAHRKLACRAKAKDVTRKMKKGVMAVLKDVGYMENDPVEDLQMFLMPWLYNETFDNISRRVEMEEMAARLIEEPLNQLQSDHAAFLELERKRL